MSGKRRSFACAAVLAMLLAACAWAGGIERFTPAESDAASDAEAAAPRDAGPEGEAEAAPPPTNGCPSGRGPTMVRIADRCIDSTEVTEAQYSEFLARDAGSQPVFCAWNKSFVPSIGPVVQPQNCKQGSTSPQVCVDWCDAFAFCAWSGKRLCAAANGGGGAFDRPTDAMASEWFAACAGPDLRSYPYASSFSPLACNVAEQDRKTRTPAGAIATCVGSVTGLYDMVGNAWEWEDACTALDGGASPMSERCRIRGGSYTDDQGKARCDVAESAAREFQQENVGFRCCAASAK